MPRSDWPNTYLTLECGDNVLQVNLVFIRPHGSDVLVRVLEYLLVSVRRPT